MITLLTCISTLISKKKAMKNPDPIYWERSHY